MLFQKKYSKYWHRVDNNGMEDIDTSKAKLKTSYFKRNQIYVIEGMKIYKIMHSKEGMIMYNMQDFKASMSPM